VKEKCLRFTTPMRGRVVLVLSFVVATTLAAATIYAQSAPNDAEDAMQQRITRARAMAAAHNLTAAAFELDAILKSAPDDAVRDVAGVMLMGIYLEQAEYARAQTLLESTFNRRVAQNEGSVRSYFAMAGQSVNGVRAHLERYRAFGIDIKDKDLPTEAVNDLDRVRSLLESIADQARKMSSENSKNTDAMALLEDVASIRGTLARNKDERKQWQHEFTNVRQKLAASETRIASSRGGGSTAGTVSMNPVNASSPVTESDSQSTTANHTSAPAKTASAPPASRDAPSMSVSQGGKLLDVGLLLDRATQRVSPTYPQVAKTQRITGIVKVYVVVDETGTVASIQRTSGPSMLQQAAMEAARRWKFRPTLVSGQPVRVVGFINFNFTL
jgi:TonB family protein